MRRKQQNGGALDGVDLGPVRERVLAQLAGSDPDLLEARAVEDLDAFLKQYRGAPGLETLAGVFREAERFLDLKRREKSARAISGSHGRRRTHS